MSVNTPSADRGGFLFSASLPFELSSVAEARRLLRGALLEQGLTGRVVDDAVLVLSELVTNSIQHGAPKSGGLLDVWWDVRKDRLRIGVQDGGPQTLLTPRPLTADDTGGRGLFIVDHVCDAWQVDYDHGMRVIAHIRISDTAVPVPQ